MKSTFVAACLTTAATARSWQPAAPQHILSNPPAHEENVYRIPTAYESAVMARRIMHLSNLGELVTTFPPVKSPSNDDLETSENRPANVAGAPIGLVEYIADCEPESGSPTMLAINIATPYKNYYAGSNISLSLRWWPEQDTSFSSQPSYFWSGEEKIPTPHTPAAMPRFSLQGHLEKIEGDVVDKLGVAACFLRTHPDSVLWQPGNDIHSSEYVRFVPEELYWFGGFGDRSYIGWIPIEDWRNVTVEEVEACRLPGEKDQKSWSDGFRAWKEWL
ncbi:hypothetical protein MBLNU230_g7497t1 [Neophaeotheca triangularis]